MSDFDYTDYAYWEAPAGKKWHFIGTCTCRGVDMACADRDELWELVDDARSLPTKEV